MFLSFNTLVAEIRAMRSFFLSLHTARCSVGHLHCAAGPLFRGDGAFHWAHGLISKRVEAAEAGTAGSDLNLGVLVEMTPPDFGHSGHVGSFL